MGLKHVTRAVLGAVFTAVLALCAPPAYAAPTPTASSAGTAAGPVLAVAAVTASGSDGHVAANTLDGSLATRWSAKGDGVWITYNLGSAKTVGSVTLAWYQGNARRATFDVVVSPNGVAWTTVLSRVVSSGTTVDFETYDFPDTSARFVRIVGHGNTTDDTTGITEARVLGADGGRTCTYPADVLNLTNWYEGLPTGAEEDPDNVYQPQLATFKVDPWFVATPDCTGVQFRAAVNGVTTSGSNYPRSELREMNGSNKASWSSTSGTSTMVIKEKVTHLPATKPHIVAGQIHGSTDDLAVFRLEGSNLYVTNGDDAHYKLVTSSYVLGTVFEAKFVVSGGVIKAYYNGALVATISLSFSGAYFKAGAYTQANCGNSAPCSTSNYGEVVIQSLTVTHT